MRSANHGTQALAGDAINISDVLRGVGRRWKMVAFMTGLFAVAGLLVILLSAPIYTAETQILLKSQESPYTRVNVAAPVVRQPVSDRDMKSQVAVLKSRELALRVIQGLKLAGTREFDPLKRGIGIGGQLKILLGFSPDPRRQNQTQRALGTWYKNLKVYSIPQTRIIVISFSAHNPRTAAAVTNALAQAYKASQSRKTGEARDWLKEQIGRLTREVEDIEKRASAYRTSKGLFKGAQSSLRRQELSELSSQIIKASSERSHAQARARAIREMLRKRGSVDASAEVLKSPLIQRLREQQSRLQRRMAELSTTYLDNHPKVRAVRREMAGLKRQIASEAQKIATSLEEQARIAASREAALRASFAKLKAKVSEGSIAEVKLRELERQAKSKRSLLESYLARYGDAQARDRKIAQLNRVEIISPADVPVMPSFPRPGPILILSMLAGLLLGLGAAFIAEVMGAVARMSGGDGWPAQAAAAMPQAGEPRPQAVMTPPAPATPVAPAAPAAPPAPVAPAALAATAPAMQPVRNDAASAEPGMGPDREVETGQKEAAPVMSAVPANAAHAPGPVLARLPGVSGAGSAQVLAMAPLADPQGSYAKGLAGAGEWIQSLRKGNEGQIFGLAAVGGVALDCAAASLALGRILAENGMKVVLADADMAAASLDSVMPEEGGKGISELLCGQGSFVDIIRRDEGSALHVIHAGGLRQLAAPKIGSTVMEAVLGAMAEAYDIVLVNEGESRYPANRESSILPLCDAVIVAASPANAGAAQGLCAALRKAAVEHTARMEIEVAAEDGLEEAQSGKDTKARVVSRRVASLF